MNSPEIMRHPPLHYNAHFSSGYLYYLHIYYIYNILLYLRVLYVRYNLYLYLGHFFNIAPIIFKRSNNGFPQR